MLADAETAPALSDALLEAGALSVGLEEAQSPDQDAAARPHAETHHAIFAEPGAVPEALWHMNRMRVLIAADRSAERMLAQAAQAVGIPPPAIATVRGLAERDWVRSSQAQFEPLHIGRLWVVPTWREPPDAGAINLRLDPGLAFGTGSHPSTRLCLQWLDEHVRAGMRVLDYGCGSGILAIAAAKLGAGGVRGVDVDPAALQAARDNSRLNAVTADYTAPEHLDAKDPKERFDVVIANILANPLIVLAPVLLQRLAPGGALVLAGVLQRQAAQVIEAYRQADAHLDLSIWAAEGDWVCLAGRLG